MPTPFMHLRIAEQIRLAAIERYGENGRLPRRLAQSWPAFYLGSVAADCQETAGLSRVATHFYETPPEPDNMAYPRLLAAHPALADARRLPPDQAVFVAAYSVHLLYDLLWFRRVLIPYFAEATDWPAPFAERHLVHNIVLTYLDQQALESLPPTAAATLATAQPDRWLPFVPDEALVRWRDRIVAQLEPNGVSQTIRVYANRMLLSPEEFAANLRDPDWMQSHVFNFVPVVEIQALLEGAIYTSLDVMADYLRFGP